MARRDGNGNDPYDPYGSFNFILEIDSITAAGFSECTGLDSETDVVEYREGNEAITVRKLPGLKKFSNITLKRGQSKDTELFAWRKQVMDGVIERHDLSIVLRGENGIEVLRWNLVGAWPCKYVAPEFKANANEIAIETLELCHEGITEIA